MASPRSHLSRLSQLSWTSLTQADPSPRRTGLWLTLSFGFGILYSSLALQQAFAGPFVVQDDARQHVFWMQRFLDPALFPNDLIADYFQSVAPWGYRLLYRIAAWGGIEPFTFNKILPLPITLLITFYCFQFTLALLPVPFSAFISTVLLNQTLWVNSDVASATPRAFIYPVLIAFLYYVVRGRLWPCLITLLLQGLFYPQTLLLSLGLLTLRLFRWRSQQSWLTPWKKLGWTSRDQRRFSLVAVAVAFAILLIYALQSSAYGPTISKAEALQLPEFFPGGRSSFFSDDFFKYWLRGRSGLIHYRLLTPATQALAILLPFFCLNRSRFKLLKHSHHLGILTQLTLSSLGMFFLAHALLFKLHLPSRYVQHSLRVVLSVGAAIVVVSLLDVLISFSKSALNLGNSVRQITSQVVLFTVVGVVLLYPLTLDRFPATGYIAPTQPQLYQFIAQQPKTTLVASLSRHADNISSLSARSVLASRGHSIPYHLGYYRPLRARLQNLISAQYAPTLADAQALIRTEGITHWLLDAKSFDLQVLSNDDWLLQYQPQMNEAIASLRKGETPALAMPELQKICSDYRDDKLILLSASCLLEQSGETGDR